MTNNDEQYKNDEKFRLLFEKSFEPILIIDGYKFIDCNDATVKKLKYKYRKDLFNMHPSKLSPEYQPDGKLSSDKANKMMDIAYEIGYHRFEWVHCDTLGNEFIMDIALTKIPYKGKHILFTTWRDITKQKEFESNILQREKQLSLLFEQSADGILIGIKGGEIIGANESICKITGYSKEELIGVNINILFDEEELISKPLRYDLVKKGDTIINERNIKRKDGSILPVEMNTKILDDGRMQAMFRDLTSRKKAETLLKESEEKYRNIFLNSPLGIFHYDMNGVITDCNDHFSGIIGSSKKLLVGLNMVRDLNNKQIISGVKESLINGEAYYEDYYTSVTANKTTYVRILFKGIKDDHNNIISGLGLVEDITERRKAEQDLKLSEEKFKSLATLLPEVIYETDNQGNLTFVNLKAFEIFEYTMDDFKKGVNIFSVLAPYEIERAKTNFGKLMKGGKSKGEKYIALTKTGKQFPILIYSDLIKIGNKISGLRGIIVNIHDIEKTQEELRKSEQKFRLLFENSQDAIFITDNEGIVDCNMQTLNIFGVQTKDEILQKTSADFSPEYQPDGLKSEDKSKLLLEKAINGEKNIFEWVHKRKNGKTFYAEVSLIPFLVNNKPYLQSIVRDISERKEIEQKIYNAVIETEEKERQRLASDIHDELGPLLSSLKMYIGSLNEKNDIEKQKFLKEKLQNLINEVIINIRDVSNALSPYLLSKYGLNVALRSFLNSSDELINVNFKINFENERFPINIETVFYRVIKELYNNTLKHAHATKIKVVLLYSKNELSLIYEDNGIGINKNEIEKVENYGMGIFNITNRIKSINGTYKIYSQEKGFKFKISKETEIIK